MQEAVTDNGTVVLCQIKMLLNLNKENRILFHNIQLKDPKVLILIHYSYWVALEKKKIFFTSAEIMSTITGSSPNEYYQQLSQRNLNRYSTA